MQPTLRCTCPSSAALGGGMGGVCKHLEEALCLAQHQPWYFSISHGDQRSLGVCHLDGQGCSYFGALS